MTRKWLRYLTEILGESWDLVAVSFAAIALTVVAIFMTLDPADLSAATLAVLALLAGTQVRTRRELSQAKVEPVQMLLDKFPSGLTARRSHCNSLMYIGVAMHRTLPVVSRDFHRIVATGGDVRLMLLDPDVPGLAEAAAFPPGPDKGEQLRSIIRARLKEIDAANEELDGKLQVRLMPFVPRIGINSIDVSAADGQIVVQHYEYRPGVSEPGPIMSLGPEVVPWYRRFRDEAERMWEDGTPWPRGEEGVNTTADE